MTGPQRIDTHHHVVPPEYAAWLRRRGLDAGGLPIPAWDVDADLAAQDACGVQTAILSVSTPGVHLGDAQEARAMARRVNEFAATVVQAHPDRFGFFATLTLPDVDGALAEISYAFDELHADGVVLLANVRGAYLGVAAFDTVFDELNRRRAVVFVHPSFLPGVAALPGLPPFVADFLLDTTRAAIRLAGSGTLRRCPDLRVILSHAGGFVPYAAHRISAAAWPDGNPADGLAELRKFYFDIALSGTPTALPSLLAFAAPDHILFGTDWPYAPVPVAAAMTAMYERFALSSVQREAIDRGTARALLPRLRSP
jgi:predicted TIM-barrel fold metal-dependent hydrolase